MTVVVSFALVPVSGVEWIYGITALALGMGWLSSRIGEGLIYSLRVEVFSHVVQINSVRAPMRAAFRSAPFHR